jgi:hypothetical protein
LRVIALTGEDGGLGPVFEATVESVEEAKMRLVKNGCTIVKDEPDVPRCDLTDPFGLIYNLTSEKVLCAEMIMVRRCLCGARLLARVYS